MMGMRRAFTDGPTRSVKVRKQTVTLKFETPKNMATEGRASGLAIQTMRRLTRQPSVSVPHMMPALL